MKMDKTLFLKEVSNFSNHRFLLWPALQATSGEVVEMGMGSGSTPFLREYCQDTKRMLYSYENDFEWWRKMQDYNGQGHKVTHIIDWDDVAKNHLHPSVVLIDHAPGHRRMIDVQRFAQSAEIVVMHDTEPAADHGYQMRQFITNKAVFKWYIDYPTIGAWASAASNFIDVTKFEI